MIFVYDNSSDYEGWREAAIFRMVCELDAAEAAKFRATGRHTHTDITSPWLSSMLRGAEQYIEFLGAKPRQNFRVFAWEHDTTLNIYVSEGIDL